MKPSDISLLTNVSDPQISPDGQHVAYVVSRVDDEANTYRSQIWVSPTDGSSSPRALTSGDHRDGAPRWSPDGSQLAFASSRTKDPAGKTRSTLHLLPFGIPGETVTLAQGNEGFGQLAFSPDGKWLAVTHRTRGDHYASDEVGRRPPRKIDHLNFSLNGQGFTLDRPSHVYVIATDGSTGLVNLTPGSDEFSSPVWMPDSSRLTAAMNRHRPDYATDVCLIDLDLTVHDKSDDDADESSAATNVHLITDGSGMYGYANVTADGSQLVVAGFNDSTFYPQNCHVGIMAPEAAPEGEAPEPQWFTTGLDRTWMPFICPTMATPLSGGDVLAAVEDRGNTHLYRVTPTTGDVEPVVSGDLSVTSFAARQVDGELVIAYTATTRDRPNELFVVTGDGSTQQLTSLSSAFVAKVNPQAGEHFLAPSGDHEVDAWIFRPKDFDPAKTYPTLLNIHGGPFTQYGNFFMDEFQMQTEAGYVVLCSNPRGGSGRDNDWATSILGPKHHHPGTGWGGADYEDCMAVVDAALDQFDFIDPDRLGVLGGSYGGFMTSWIVTHTDRFAAACSERAVNNLLSLEYNSDIAGLFSAEIGVRFVDDPDEFMAMSPITYVKDLNTPLLIIHSEEDLRCPSDQATQLFVACQLLGKEDVEYYLFPGETHELSRSGTPIHRKQRAEIIHEFFDKHLQPT